MAADDLITDSLNMLNNNESFVNIQEILTSPMKLRGVIWTQEVEDYWHELGSKHLCNITDPDDHVNKAIQK